MTQEVEIQNKQELLTSLNRELINVSQQITAAHKQKLLEQKTGELADIERKIIEAKSQLDEVLHAHEIHTKSISNDKAIHEAHVSTLKQSAEEISTAVSGLKKEIVDLNIAIGDRSQKLDSILREIENASELLDKKKKTVSDHNDGIDLLSNQLISSRKELANITDLYVITKAQGQKDVSELLKQKEAIENEILIKQRSLDGFKENKEKMERDLDTRQSDLIILENRLRDGLTKAGIAFKL